jgi:hypothetical protein
MEEFCNLTKFEWSAFTRTALICGEEHIKRDIGQNYFTSVNYRENAWLQVGMASNNYVQYNLPENTHPWSYSVAVSSLP